jgi:putative IMPACT (imprinted ancient) family translation regulator
MKPTLTTLKSVISFFLLLIITNTAVCQSGQNNGMSFLSTPVLISGSSLSVGAKYKFTNVYPGTSAVVTIVSSTGGASVVILDDNNLTKPEAFSPKINVPANSNGLVEFKIEFFQGNGVMNLPRTIDTVRVTAMDIDGNAKLHEVDALDMGAGSVVSYYINTLEIAVVKTGNEYKATNIGGKEYPEVDTSAKQVMFTLMNTNINQFTYKVGANNLATSAVARQKGNYFKGFDYASTFTLPVKYNAFTAVSKNEAVSVNWVTESEVNNSHYEVERSFDGIKFSTIGTVVANSKKEYEFNDASNLLKENTIAYYRLKQVDVDGTYSYSSILSVRFKIYADIKMHISPNPFVETVSTRFIATEKGKAEIRIMNVKGQVVSKKIINIVKGYNNIQIDGLSNLSNGIFVASLIVNNKSIASQQIIK